MTYFSCFFFQMAPSKNKKTEKGKKKAKNTQDETKKERDYFSPEFKAKVVDYITPDY